MTLKRLKENTIRVDDRVQIITPKFVERVGYPLSVKAVHAELEKDPRVQDALDALFKMVTGRTQRERSRTRGEPDEKHRCRRRIEQELAYLRTASKGFGGNTRSIYWKELPELQGAQARVLSIRTAMTGERHPGGYSGSYDEQEWEPAFLADMKAHRLVRLELKEMRESRKDARLVFGLNHTEALEIPVYHLKKLEEGA